MPHPYPSQEGNDFLRAASTFAKATADLPSNSQDVKDERRSRESFNIKSPILGGESALRRNRNPADCKEEEDSAEEALSGRDVGCPAGSAQRQIHEG